jgi:hypothetical protein
MRLGRTATARDASSFCARVFVPGPKEHRLSLVIKSESAFVPVGRPPYRREATLKDRAIMSSVKLQLLTALAFLASVGASAQTVSFVARLDLPVGQGPSAIATADFNADGNLDLVTSNEFSNNISVLLGNGDGTFQTAVSYAAGTNPIAVTVGDFNGDGKPDLLVVNGNSSVSVLLGNGDGTFQAPVATNIVTNQLSDVTVGDFNGDGKLDLAMPVAVTQEGDSALTVMLGNGNGTFAAPIVANAGPVPTPVAMQSVDINGDGKLDLVTVNSAAVSVFLGQGNGTFQAPVDSAVSTPPAGFALADFNGDGKLDLAFQGDGTTSVLLGNGDGTFQPAVTSSNSLGSSDTVVAGDFNGDGKVDLLVPGVAVLLGQGDGNFQNPIFSTMPGLDAVVGDFNGDGKLDVATTRSTSSIPLASVALGNGDGTFQVGTSVSPPSEGPGGRTVSSIIAGDFNGDGKSDVMQLMAQTEFNGWFAVFLGNGNGTFLAPLVTFLDSPCFNLCYAASGDFNKDGKLDLAVSVNGNIGIFLGNGDGTFQPEVNYAGAGSYVAVADFNADGNPDIVMSDGENVSVFLGTGTGSFGAPITSPVGGPANGLAIADFNGDGKPDLAVATGSSVAILLGNGNGTFATAVDYPTGAGSVSVAVADFNNNGTLDLATANSSSNTVSVLMGNGDGTFGAAINLPVGGTPNFVAVSNFNGDQNADIAAFNSFWEDVSVLLGNGDGTFQTPVNVGALGFGSIAVADFNGDLSPDLAVAGSPISLLFNRASGPDPILVPNAVNFGAQVPGVTSAGETVTLNNIGRSALTITSITVAGPQSKEFAQSNTCDVSVAAGASCAIVITFTPASPGAAQATLDIADNGPGSPQGVPLSGTGAVPTISLTPTSLTFASQAVGTPSAIQTLTLTNTGAVPVIIAQVSYSGDFSETSNCIGTIAAGGTCQISVVFTPTISGKRSGVLSIADNATGSPQAVALTGTGIGLGLAVAAGGSGSATVTSGQTASYSLVIGGGGVSGAATITCTGAPTGATCSVPSTENLSATTTTAFSASVTTTSRTTSNLGPAYSTPTKWMWALAIFGLAFLPAGGRRRGSRLRRTLPIFLLMLVCSCGGGGGNSSGSQTNPNGTPAGTYQLVVSGSSSAANQSISLTLVVQ